MIVCKIDKNDLVECDKQIELSNQYEKNNRSLEYKEVLEKYGFNVEIEKDGALCAYGNFVYVVNDEKIKFSLDAWANWGFTFYNSIGIDIPVDVLKILKLKYGNKIKERIPGRDAIPYFFLEGTKEQMINELDMLLHGIAEYKYKLKYPTASNNSLIHFTLEHLVDGLKNLKIKFNKKRDQYLLEK